MHSTHKKDLWCFVCVYSMSKEKSPTGHAMATPTLSIVVWLFLYNAGGHKLGSAKGRSGTRRKGRTHSDKSLSISSQYSFSTDAKLLGAPENHVVKVREVRLAAGAEFVIMICGNIMTMPGLPKEPAANRIDLGEDGQVVGLF